MKPTGKLAFLLVVSSAGLAPAGCAVGTSLDEPETIRRDDASSGARDATDGADASDGGSGGTGGAAPDASEPSDGAGGGADASPDVSEGSDDAGGDADADAGVDSGVEAGSDDAGLSICAGQAAGAYVCDGATLTRCGEDLATSTTVQCGSAQLCALHVDGQCAVCVDGEHQCSGADLKQCSADHLSFTKKATCASAGLCNAGAGQCTSAACVEGQHRCTGADLEICNAMQTGFDEAKTCASADLCDAQRGLCTVCIPKTTDCASPTQTETCAVDGLSWSKTTCPANKSHCVGVGQCVECVTAADCSAPADPCKAATCSSGVCGTQPKSGAACDDGDACTSGDKCDASGVCGGTPKVCGALDACHSAGTCDPSSGVCSNPVKSGAACDDGNACTSDDKCGADGVCGGTSYGCNDPDPECPVPGTCNGDGTCTYKARPDPVCIRLTKLDQVCKLINDKNQDNETANKANSLANLRGTGLGVPVTHSDGNMYLFFGDSAGARSIWPLGGNSLPDAVGYATVAASQVASDPSQLCGQLRFVMANQDDFAGAWMLGSPLPPAGYINNPAGQPGKNDWPNIPGSGEVPSGAFSYGGSIYVFYTTVTSWQAAEAKGSYLAKWSSPSKTNLPNYDILYKIDDRTSGALRGDFINVAPLVVGNYVYLYGTGAFRQSTVHLARKLLSKLGTSGSFESYDAATKTWVAANAAAAPIVDNTKMGELSVRYFATVNGGLYVMMNQEVTAAGNFIMARFASAPEGPFTAPVAVAQMEDQAFQQKYCCVGGTCSGTQMFDCGNGGAFYAPYMLPEPIGNPDESFSIAFTVSTWRPYNVALMQATFK